MGPWSVNHEDPSVIKLIDLIPIAATLNRSIVTLAKGYKWWSIHLGPVLLKYNFVFATKRWQSGFKQV